MHQIKLFANTWGWKKTEPEINDWLKRHPNIKNVQLSVAYGGIVAIIYEVDE